MKKQIFISGLIIGLFFCSISIALPPPKYVKAQKEQAQLIVTGTIIARKIIKKIKCTDVEIGSKNWCSSRFSDGQIGFATIKIKQVVRNRSNLLTLNAGDTVRLRYSIAPASMPKTWLNSQGLLTLTLNDLVKFWLDFNEKENYFESVAYGSIEYVR